MVKLSLSDIKVRSTGHFFDKDAMRFFSSAGWKGSTHRTTYCARYDKITDVNYVRVVDPWGVCHYHRFEPSTGALIPVDPSNVPVMVRKSDKVI